MSEQFAFDVFLSHSSKDKPIVREIAQRLKADGIRVWLDEEQIKPGDSIPAKVEEGLENSRVLILCMSANAFGSDWSQLESYTYRFRDPLNKELRFIPVRLDDATIKGSLAQFLYIDWEKAKNEKKEYGKLLEACQQQPSHHALLPEKRDNLQIAVLSLGHTESVKSVAWSSDNKHALSGSGDNTVRLLDTNTGKCLRVFEEHTASVRSVAWSSDNKFALSASSDKTVRLWDTDTGKCLRVLEGHTGYVNSVVWSSDNKHALSASDDKTVRLWDTDTGKCIRVFEGHTSTVWSVVWSSENKRALSASSDKTIRLWDTDTGKCWRVLGHISTVYSVAWSGNNKHALSASADNTIRLWDTDTGECLRVLEGHTSYVENVAWSSDNKHALSASGDNTIRLWDTDTGRCLRVLEGHTDCVWSVAWSNDNEHALSASEDNTVRLWDTDTGKCLRVLEGHTDEVHNVAWSSDNKHALSASGDNTVRLWDTDTGKCLRALEGHTGYVNSVAWSSDNKHALSASVDKTVRLWDTDTGKCVRVLEGHTDRVWSVAWSSDNKHALSASADNTVRLWDTDTGKCLRVLEGHTKIVLNIAWSSDNKHALSVAADNTVRLWDTDIGKCLRVLEGHTDEVNSVAWSSDNKHALSVSADKTVRLWDTDTGKCLRVLEGHTTYVMSIAWSRDNKHALSSAINGVLRKWDLSEFISEKHDKEAHAFGTTQVPKQVQYTNAKVLLVGDTGVGKSTLAERLVHNRFVLMKSSHARKAYVLDSKATSDADGIVVHQETMLWDLAGQPAYRLVHQLSMEDAALTCILFDNRNETNPFESAAYWSQVLDQSRTTANVKKILVASRINVGGLPASRERIEAFAKDNGFDKFIATSAETGEGCDELLENIKTSIPWDDLPKVTTEGPLAPLRAYVAKLKGEKDSYLPVSRKLFTISELYEGFASDYGKKISLEEFISHMERLEATDSIDILVFHSTGAHADVTTRVLLDPTRVDAYASAMLVAAKDEPDGPGHLLESRVLNGEFKLDQDERLSDPECEKHVLLFVMENLLVRDLALKERIKGKDYFVFPSQCTAALKFSGAATFGVAINFAGSIRSIYATLIAQLAHYEGFKKREFYQDAAAYYPDKGGRCIIRLHDQRRGQGELELSFDTDTPVIVRQGFIEFIEKHVEAKSTIESVSKRYAYHCATPECSEPFEDKVVKWSLEKGYKDLLCQYCRQITPLVDLLAPPTEETEAVAVKIGSDAVAGRKRMTAAHIIKAKEAEGIFDIFLSHNSKDKVAVEKIARRLRSVGIRPWLDKWNLAPGDTLMDALENAVKTINCAALCFGPADKGKWHIMEIRAYVERWANGDARMIPVILPGVDDTPELPMFVRQTLWVDMREWEKDDDDNFYRLVCGILGRAPGDSPMKKFNFRHVAEWQGIEL